MTFNLIPVFGRTPGGDSDALSGRIPTARARAKCIARSRCWFAALGLALLGAAGCETQGHDDYYYHLDSQGREIIDSKNSADWRDHERERVNQSKWERDRGYYDEYDYRRDHRDGR